MTTRLAMMRHGVTSWNSAHRIQGRTDIPLTDGSRRALGALAFPRPWDTAALWSSPLLRAYETAEIVAGRPPQTSENLMEMDWGDWEGLQGENLRNDPASGFRDIDDWGWTYTPPNGESAQDLRTRVLAWMDALIGDNVAVCHIGTMRVALATAWGWNFDGPCPFSIKRNRLYILTRSGDAWHPHTEPIRLIERPS